MSAAGLGRPLSLEERASLANQFEASLENFRIPTTWGRHGYQIHVSFFCGRPPVGNTFMAPANPLTCGRPLVGNTLMAPANPLTRSDYYLCRLTCMKL